MRPPILALTIWLLSSPAFSQCDCVWEGPFTRVQADTDLVVAARVISTSGNSVDLDIEQLLRGEEHRERVRLWLDTGKLCRPQTGTFPPDTRWVMAIDRITEVPEGGFDPGTPNRSYGRPHDYSISRCGGYWLTLEETMVSGNLAGGPRWERNPKMSPVLLELVADYVRGELDEDALVEASRTDPELQRLKLETRSFLRQQRNPLLTPE